MARRRRQPAKSREPMGGPISVDIQSLSHDGRGIARVDGKATFVWGALPGEAAVVQRISRGKNFDVAEVVELSATSAQRVTPKCAVFGECGGCALQHLAADQQINHKQQVLADNLRRIGGLAADKWPQNWLPPLNGQAWHYRRRARMAVQFMPKTAELRVGFRQRNSKAVTAMSRCEVLAKPLTELIEPLKALISKLTIRSDIPQVEVALGEADTAAGRPIAAVVFQLLKPATDGDEATLKAFAAKHNVDVYLQPDRPKSLYPLTSTRRLFFSIEGSNIGSNPSPDRLKLDFQPTDFIQVNAALNNQTIEQALSLLNPQPHERILDLFCGLGNFTLPLAQRCEAVVGVEGDAALVSRAIENATANGLANTSFFVDNLFVISNNAPWLRGHYDAVLLDPPRAGAKELLPALRKMAAKRIVYISCHPGTLARDAGVLVNEMGYSLTTAGVMDMFPHTAHVESIALFEKR